MRERPILMHARSINGILEDRKSQTRRIIKPQPETAAGMNCTRLRLKNRRGETFVDVALEASDFQDVVYSMSPYGQPGDRLWVREMWQYADWTEDGDPYVGYSADATQGLIESESYDYDDWGGRLSEIEEKYCEIAARRLDQFEQKEQESL